MPKATLKTGASRTPSQTDALEDSAGYHMKEAIRDITVVTTASLWMTAPLESLAAPSPPHLSTFALSSAGIVFIKASHFFSPITHFIAEHCASVGGSLSSSFMVLSVSGHAFFNPHRHVIAPILAALSSSPSPMHAASVLIHVSVSSCGQKAS